MDFLGLPDGLQDRLNVIRPSFSTLADGTQPHGLIRCDGQSGSSGTAVEHSDGSRVPHLKPARSGLPPVAISNAVRRIGGFARLAYTVGVPDRSPAQERGLTADD